MLNTNQYLSTGLALIKQYTASWMTINNLEKSKISDMLRRGMIEKKNTLFKKKKKGFWKQHFKLPSIILKYNFIKQSNGGLKVEGADALGNSENRPYK